MENTNSNQAIIIQRPGTVILKELFLSDPQEHEVQVKTQFLGLCGSDQHMFMGSYNGPHKYPVIMGHECSGIVTAVGKAVKNIRKGDRVVVEANLWCGMCHNCKSDKNLCETVEKRGLTIDGDAREYFNIDAKYVYKIPEKVDMMLACMAEPFAVALHGILRAFGENPKKHKNQRVAVIGAGPIGMATAMILKKYYEFEHVEISDLVKSRLCFANRHEIDTFIQPQSLNIDFEKYSEIYRNPNAPDVVFESTGINAVLDKVFHYVAPGGQIVCFAPICSCNIEGGFPVLKAVDLIGSMGGAGYIPDVLQIFTQHQQYYKDMITHVFPFREYKKALDLQCSDQNRMKIVLNFSE